MNFYSAKRNLYSPLLLLVLIVSKVFAISAPIQNSNPPAGYYVIVAAYYSNGKGYAERYAATFEDKGYTGKYAFFPEKNMFLVYLDKYDKRNVSIEAMRKVRNENVKEDAWVYVYRPEDIAELAEPEPKPEPNPEPEPEPKPEPEPEPKTNPEPEPELEPELEPSPEPESEPTSAEAPAGKPEPEVNPYEGMHPVFFNLHHGQSAELVEGQIQVIDPDKGRVVTMVDANEWEYINKPSNTHPEVQLVADIFGYRRVNHVIHLDDPELDSADYFVEVRNDSILVDFELIRYHTGDIFTMFNVYFFSHSAIMRPESTFELDQLVGMLNENPKSRIRLHGHTNGNSSGDMRYRPEDDHNLFTTSGALEKTASARVLSEERANVVKRYLIDKGISEDRMEVKGWGGKRMLYKKTDPQAIKNVRVEVEILEE